MHFQEVVQKKFLLISPARHESAGRRHSWSLLVEHIENGAASLACIIGTI